jgi:hypothetical protein
MMTPMQRRRKKKQGAPPDQEENVPADEEGNASADEEEGNASSSIIPVMHYTLYRGGGLELCRVAIFQCTTAVCHIFANSPHSNDWTHR